MRETASAIEEFLGTTHVFALALTNLLEASILREIAGAQLTGAQMKALKLIARAEAQTIGDVAAFLGVSDAAASKTVDRLVRRRLVRRTEREQDRRANELALTTAGTRIISQYEAVRERRLAEVFREVPSKELEKAASLLGRIAENIAQAAGVPRRSIGENS
ncbi:MAG: MarR family winged helix-turn-helix transcriptional regulator [Acidobacteriota bacterium]